MDKLSNYRPWYTDYLLIIIGTGLMSLAINSIFEPINLVTGGVTGIAIIVKGVTAHIINNGIPLWLTNLVLNIPLFILGIRIKGIRFFKRTIVATGCMSVWLYLIPQINFVDDLVLASIFGGVITGVGIGMVFVAHATTGGTDLLAAIIQHYFRHYSIAQILQIVDGVVVLAGAYIFGLNKALYAIICIFAVSKISDGIIEGLKYSKVAYIITSKYDEVAKSIMYNLNRGVTAINAKGMYFGQDTYMLFCVVSKKEIVEVKELVIKIDADAFVIVQDAREVLGEGFIEDNLSEGKGIRK